MSTKPSIIPFNTKNNQYLFDGVSGEVIPSDKYILYIIQNYYKMSRAEMEKNLGIGKSTDEINTENFQNRYDYVKSLIEEKMFYPDITLGETEDKLDELMLEATSSQLLLVLTEKCNMRCEYCVYSEKYPKEMTYSSKDMDFVTAKQGVDLYFKIHNEKVKHGYKKEPMISFYGGEPFLMFPLIREIVEYVKTINDKTRFYVTTNGILLNEEMADFISDNNFNVTFSLDGYKDNHDRNRVTAGGKVTFDILFEKIKMLQEIKRKKGVEQIISFNSCYDNYTDLLKCAEFFLENYELFKPFYNIYAQINPIDTCYYKWTKERVEKEGLQLQENRFEESYKEIRKIFYDTSTSNEQFRKIVVNLFMGQFMLFVRNKWSQSCFNNSCLPLSKLALYPDGTYTLCEKMNKRLPIGNVQSGIDYSELKRIAILMLDNFSKKKCSVCPAKRICSACFMFMESNGEINPEFCAKQKNSIKGRFEELYSLLEEDVNLIQLLGIRDEHMDLLSALN